jgi:hypothetical protein
VSEEIYAFPGGNFSDQEEPWLEVMRCLGVKFMEIVGFIRAQ